MKNRRAKLAASATVLGLGALGGVALGTNPGMPAAAQQTAGNQGRIVTSASGATMPVTQPVAVRSGPATHAPIVTRASGATSAAIGSTED